MSSVELERQVRVPATRAPGGGQRFVVFFRATMAVLVLLLAWSAAHADAPQFHAKAMPIRLACSPVAALVVPCAWWAVSRRADRPPQFPYLPASLIALTLVIDLAGNATGWYAAVEDFDDAVHVVNPMLLVTALSLLLAGSELPSWAVRTVSFGLGCAGIVLWELLEYALLQEVGAVGLRLSLRDTLSDQAWGLLGAGIGATVPWLGPSLVSAAGARKQLALVTEGRVAGVVDERLVATVAESR